MWARNVIEEDIQTLEVSSSAFRNGGFIPKKYTCKGENINPPLTINKIPEDTKSMVLIIDDPDAPVRTWTHWLVWNIMPTSTIAEKSIPGIEGITDFASRGYNGPCPPSGIHNYHFKIYALDTILDIDSKTQKNELEKKIKPYTIGFGELVGKYKHIE